MAKPFSQSMQIAAMSHGQSSGYGNYGRTETNLPLCYYNLRNSKIAERKITRTAHWFFLTWLRPQIWSWCQNDAHSHVHDGDIVVSSEKRFVRKLRFFLNFSFRAVYLLQLLSLILSFLMYEAFLPSPSFRSAFWS